MLRNLMFRVQRWFDHRFKIGIYELRGNEIIVWRGLRKPDMIRIDEIESWQITPEMIFDIVTVHLKTGVRRQMLDTYDDLISILKTNASERERNERSRNRTDLATMKSSQ
jgi:hypothetical protein